MAAAAGTSLLSVATTLVHGLKSPKEDGGCQSRSPLCRTYVANLSGPYPVVGRLGRHAGRRRRVSKKCRSGYPARGGRVIDRRRRKPRGMPPPASFVQRPAQDGPPERGAALVLGRGRDSSWPGAPFPRRRTPCVSLASTRRTTAVRARGCALARRLTHAHGQGTRWSGRTRSATATTRGLSTSSACRGTGVSSNSFASTVRILRRCSLFVSA